jgi:hypothetical protein
MSFDLKEMLHRCYTPQVFLAGLSRVSGKMMSPMVAHPIHTPAVLRVLLVQGAAVRQVAV